MTDKEALLLALEALHYCEALNRDVDERKMQAITVIRKLWTEHAMQETQRLGQEIEQCQCPECQIKPHASDCAVHGEPAYPKGKCNCGAQPEQLMSDRINYGMSVTQGGKRIDPMSIYKEPEQEPMAWLLTDKNINSIQVDSIQRLISRLKYAHHTDLRFRINGQDEWFEADWLKHMVRVTPPQRKPLTDDLYNELLFAVGNKCPNETRHQTALRYILQAEKGDEKAAHGIKGDA